jgi:MOSC domain-containing protein YiiM
VKVVSVNVAAPRQLSYRGKPVTTGIFKEPVEGPVSVGRESLAGDHISDPRWHGGLFRAVYGYGAGDYAYWEKTLGKKLSWGAFGENLTIDGLDTADACLGDVLSVGGAKLEVTQPRLPCFKLGLKFGDPKIIKLFLASERWGIYFRVVRPGDVKAGDAARWESRWPERLSLVELGKLLSGGKKDAALAERYAAHPALPPEPREELSA